MRKSFRLKAELRFCILKREPEGPFSDVSNLKLTFVALAKTCACVCMPVPEVFKGFLPEML